MSGSYGRLMTSYEASRRLQIQERVADSLLAEVAESYAAFNFIQSASASEAYDKMRGRTAHLQDELRMAVSAEAYADRVAETREPLGKITVASVAFNGHKRLVRIGKIDLSARSQQ